MRSDWRRVFRGRHFRPLVCRLRGRLFGFPEPEGDAVPVLQKIKPIEVGQEDESQADQAGLTVQTQEPEQKLGGHEAEKEAQEKEEEELHGPIINPSGWEYQGEGTGARGQGAGPVGQGGEA